MLKRQLAALALAVALLLTCLPVSAIYGPEKYTYIESVADFIRENGLYSDPEDDPLERALINLLDTDPQAFDLLLSYMLSSYDERSMLIPGDYLRQLLQTSGYVGVGVTMSQSLHEDGTATVTVTALHEAGSAKRAGVREGDLVLEVGGVPLDEIEFAEVPEILRFGGDEGSFVDIVVEREGVRLHFTLERTMLGEPEYGAAPLSEDTWLMRWTQFRDDTLLESFHADLAAMAETGATSLIIDLRGNSGGRLDMAFDIVEALIPEKDVHYLTMTWREGDKTTSEKRMSPGGGLELEHIVVLCDGGTASASEIIMTALCDTGHGVSLGERTYGKATAQYEIETPEDSVIILTAYKMTTATGVDYDLVGLVPDYTVINVENPRLNPGFRLREISLSPGNCSDDAQALNRALELLGLMGTPQKDYRFGEDTQAAVNNFRQQNGMARADGIDPATAAALNLALDKVAGTSETVDKQLEQALWYISDGAALATAQEKD